MRSPTRSWLGVTLLGLLAVLWAGALAFMPPDPHAVDLQNVLAGPTVHHWLGTDHLGRDLAARLIVGAEPSLIAVAIVLGASLGIGIAAGAVMTIGPAGAREAVKWLADTVLTLPTLITALVISAVFGAGPTTIALALVVTAWAPYALTVNALFDRLRAEPYWQASIALGTGMPGAVWRHMVPNAWPALGALAGADAGRAVILVASLGFIGLTADTGEPEWGAMINEYRVFLFSEPRLVLAPLLATAILSFWLNRLLDRG